MNNGIKCCSSMLQIIESKNIEEKMFIKEDISCFTERYTLRPSQIILAKFSYIDRKTLCADIYMLLMY